jgi:hypothetical protein
MGNQHTFHGNQYQTQLKHNQTKKMKWEQEKQLTWLNANQTERERRDSVYVTFCTC